MDNKQIIVSAYTNTYKDDGKIHVGNFSNGQGKYISRTFSLEDKKEEDLFLYSPQVDVRLAYIYEKDDLNGIEITKIKNGKEDGKISLSGFDFKKLLATLDFFSSLDFKSIVHKSLVLDQSILKGSEKEVRVFLETLAADESGQKALSNLENFTPTYIQEVSRRRKNLDIFKKILNNESEFLKIKTKAKIGKDEEVWQKLFESNDWMVGSDYVEVLGERKLSEHEKVDLPMRNIDGFYDIVELKLPTFPFWNKNNTPNSKLISAIAQCARYLRVAEKQSNNSDKLKELGCDIVKPRITLIYGRSNNWDEKQRENFRILNSSLSNISVLTYDHVLARAEKVCGSIEPEEK